MKLWQKIGHTDQAQHVTPIVLQHAGHGHDIWWWLLALAVCGVLWAASKFERRR